MPGPKCKLKPEPEPKSFVVTTKITVRILGRCRWGVQKMSGDPSYFLSLDPVLYLLRTLQKLIVPMLCRFKCVFVAIRRSDCTFDGFNSVHH